MAEKVLFMLINISCQLALIFLLAWLGTKVFRIRSASARSIIWLTVALCPLLLVFMNILPLDIALLHSGDVERSALSVDHPFDLTAGSYYQGDTSSSDPPPVERSLPKASAAEGAMGSEILKEPLLQQPETRSNSSHQSPQAMWYSFKYLAMLIWLFGAVVSIILTFVGLARLRELISNSNLVKDEAALGMFQQVKKEVGISRGISLLASDRVRTPFSAGFIRPCIVLPRQLLSSQKKLRMTLIHEAVHLKRFDYLVNLFCRITGSFMFFHPLFHLAIRELRVSSEEVCDGWAVRLTQARADYASCLLELSHLCAGKLPIGFNLGGSSMTRRVKSVFRGEEVYKMIGKKSLAFLSISVFLLILTASAIRMIDPASDGQAPYSLHIYRFQRCENWAGAGFFWVDTTSGNLWWADPADGKWVYAGQPESTEPGAIGAYMPCSNKCGAGLFILDTRTGKAWWARGYEREWLPLALGRPAETEGGSIGTYVPLEKEESDPLDKYGGFYILNTRTGSVWWNPPSNRDDWYPDLLLGNPDADTKDIGTYMFCKAGGGAGLFIINTAEGQVWWTNGHSWNRLDKGEAKGGGIGTYIPYVNKDGAGIHILSHRTGEGWWTNGNTWISLDEAAGDSYVPRDSEETEVMPMGRSSEDTFQGVDESGQLTLKIRSPEPGMTYGEMLLNGQPVSIETLLSRFQEATPAQRQMLIIQANRDVPHNQIVEAMNCAKSAGIKKIGFAKITREK